MCKPCCLSRPVHEKRCLEHESRSATAQSTQQRQYPRPSPTQNPLPSPVLPCVGLSPQPVVGISVTSTTSQSLTPPLPSQQPTPINRQPEIEDRVAILRDNGQRRQGGRSARSGGNCTVYIWVTVHLGNFLHYVQATELRHRMGSLRLPSAPHSPFSRDSPSTTSMNTFSN